MKNIPKKLKKEINSLKSVTDKLGKSIDRDIRPIVATLRLMGFVTTSSCSGHKSGGNPYIDITSKLSETLELSLELDILTENLLKYPKEQKYINDYSKFCEPIRKANLIETKRLIELLNEFYKNRTVDNEVRLIISSNGDALGGTRLEPQGSIVADLKTKNERYLWLKDSQKEIEDFTNFLVMCIPK